MSSSNLTASSTVTRVEQPATRFDNELIILGEGDEIVYRVDAVGARIWELLEQPRTISSLCESLAAEFAVDRARCEKDVLAFLHELAGQNLIHVRNDPSE